MSYETFYRKYRSQTFDEIVGQDHIKQTLKNAIEHDRLSHAYIFSGPRGTGKTSTARIMAKSLNCREGKSTTPCLKCDLCESITNGNSVDVIEIDAASNTGVDNIRELNEKINFMPVECLYKMYIIDEVHMLSTGAFNALLKTLGEPPKNTIFILATTEPHKIPVTIHSRCQQLHFRNLTLEEILQQLQFITEKESITIEEKSLKAIARNAGGCMRDALSLFNQIYSFKGETISYDDVLFILGSTEDKHLINFLKQCVQNQESEALKTLQGFISDGANVTQLIADILTVLRHLMLIKLNLQDEVVTDELTLKDLQSLADITPMESLKEYLDIMAQTELDLRWFSKPELLLQIRCLNLMKSQQTAQTPPPVQPQQVQAPKPTPTPAPAPEPEPAAPVVQAPTPEPEPTPTPTTSSASTGDWNTVVDRLKDSKSALFGVLKDSRVIDTENNRLTIALKQDFKFFREKLSENTARNQVNEIIKEVFGAQFQFQLTGEGTKSASLNATAPQKEEAKPSPDQHHDQRVNDIVSMFEGAVI